MNRLEEWFFAEGNKKLKTSKWLHYFEIYERHFKKFIGKSPVILEIGVQEGGSIEMWNHYFDGRCTVLGLDIDPRCLGVRDRLGADNVTILIGNQADRGFWQKFRSEYPRLDIIVDDGGHRMDEQIVTFEELYRHMSDDGVYLCEDLHTSYWPEWGGGLRQPGTFIEYSKRFIDFLHAHHIPEHLNDPEAMLFRRTTDSIHFYDSVLVLERRKNLLKPTAITK
jgi:hypothetical protein